MAFRYSTKLFTDFLAQLKTDLGNGVINLYSGAQPASPDSSIGGATLIGQVTINAGSWADGTTTNGLTFNTPSSAQILIATGAVWKFTCINAGTIGWGRFVGNSSTAGLTIDSGLVDSTFVHPRLDFSVGVTTGDAQMSKITYAVGETGIIQNMTITLSNLS